MSALAQDLATLYGRELDRLAEVIAGYDSDEQLWSTVGGQRNPGGTLAVHTVGGLLHFIGALLGDTGYVRDRDLEFSERGVPRDDVVNRVNACRDTVVPILKSLDDATIDGPMPGPLPPRMQGATVRVFMLHLLWHLGWHSGQAYYHRLAATEGAGV